MYSVSQGLKTEKDRSAIAERIKSGTIPTLSITEDSQVLAEVVMERFEAEVGNTPYFWIAATPGNPRANSVDVDPEEIRSIIMSPPESRRNGWSMDFSQQVPIERFAEGIRRGRKDWRYLELLPNGHMEFWTPLNNIFCWPQSPEEFGKRPRLNPSAVIEYPTTFLRLYRAIIDKANIQDTFAIRLYYRNVKGYRLASYPPYPPGTIAFIDQLLINQSKPFGGQHVASPPMRVASDFSPDGIAYKLIKQVYSYFELEAEVAFFNPAESKFVFP
jgi:hypothetical protein